MSQKPTVGRIVHVHLIAPGGPNKDKLVTRPARVVSDNGGSTHPNVIVDLDGWNDLGEAYTDFATVAREQWKTSVDPLPDGEAPRALTWSWPPRV